jgi:hypothetical protein
MSKLTVAFRNLEKAPKTDNIKEFLYSPSFNFKISENLRVLLRNLNIQPFVLPSTVPCVTNVITGCYNVLKSDELYEK